MKMLYIKYNFLFYYYFIILKYTYLNDFINKINKKL